MGGTFFPFMYTGQFELKKLSIFLEDFTKIENLVEYFDDFNQNLSKKSLNFFLKGVSNL